MTDLICFMPTYNKETSLDRAIESVIMQKTQYSYKLIIMDDCSTDNSNSIAQKWKSLYPDRIEIMRNNTNLKLLKSQFKAYDIYLRGVKYFCVLDADDWYIYNGKFEDAINFLEKNKNHSAYLTNLLVKTASAEYPWVSKKKKSFDFTMKDFIKGKGVFVQTSGAVFRNYFFKEGLPQDIKELLNHDNADAFEADGFRLPQHLVKGPAHFENRIESVYDISANGKYSSLREFDKKLFGSLSDYELSTHLKEYKSYYFKNGKRKFDKVVTYIYKNMCTGGGEK